MARICVDGFNLAMPQGSGIATYARNLIENLAAVGHQTQILFSSNRNLGADNLLNQLSLFDAGPVSRWPAAVGSALRLAPLIRPVAGEVAVTGEVITSQVRQRFPAASRVWGSRDIFHRANRAHVAYRRFTPIRLGPDVRTDAMHWTCPLPLYEPRTANIYTVHDLIPLRLPYTTLDNKRAYYDMCKKIVSRADMIFTVSEHSRRDIVQLLKVDERRVVNTYQSVQLPDRHLLRSDDDVAAELEAVFGLHAQGYFLFFGAEDPKKNLARLMESFACARVTAPLVIVGPCWPGASAATANSEAAQASGPMRRPHGRGVVRRYEYLPIDSLMTLVRGARATLFPSLYEGFGLPVLESMQLGTPVLTSTAGSLPEVAGDAAVMVDPYDVDAIRNGIRALDADADLRRELSARGRLQAARFSPERYQERLQDAYAPVL